MNPFKVFTSLILCILLSTFCFISQVYATSVRDIGNLDSITFWETTGNVQSYTFGVDSEELTQRLSNPLGSTNNDFVGVIGHEFYDVFYSDADGSFNNYGEYLTIEGSFDIGLPNGGALNLAEIGLNFSGTSTEYGNYVASFVALGDNAIPLSVGNAIDGDLNTYTTMGNTIGTSDRLRITLGFQSSSGPLSTIPEPNTMILLGFGLLSIAGVSRKRY